MPSSRPRALLGVSREPEVASPSEPARHRRRRPRPKSKFGQRLSVFLFAAVVVCGVVAISFFVGYLVGKLLL